MQFTTTLALLLSLTSATLAAESNKLARTADLEAAYILPKSYVPGVTEIDAPLPNLAQRWLMPKKRQQCCRSDNQGICQCTAVPCDGKCGNNDGREGFPPRMM